MSLPLRIVKGTPDGGRFATNPQAEDARVTLYTGPANTPAERAAEAKAGIRAAEQQVAVAVLQMVPDAVSWVVYTEPNDESYLPDYYYASSLLYAERADRSREVVDLRDIPGFAGQEARDDLEAALGTLRAHARPLYDDSTHTATIERAPR